MRRLLALSTILMLGLSGGCRGDSPGDSPGNGEPHPSPTHGPEVVHYGGVGEARFGMTRQELAQRLDSGTQGCSAQLAGTPQASLAFADDDRLVLVWFDSPLRTPEGVQSGMPLTKVSEVYPEAVELSAPPGSHQFDGLLVAERDRGYLFLHDGQTVQKAIAGYTDFLHRLFDTGFGSC